MKTRRQNSLGVLLRLTAFRRMWLALSVSSLGDWLGLLATTALAAYLTQDSSNLVQGAAVSGVLLVRLLPDLILGPIAGAMVDRFDRRKVAIIGDTVAGLLYLSIVFSSSLSWLLAAQFLVEAVGLFSNPAKQALWVNIVPRERLAVANQLNYVSVYGMVPVAALVFALLATTAQFFGAPPVPNAGATGALISGTSTIAIDVALVLDAGSYFLAAGVLFITRHLIPPYLGDRPAAKSIVSLIREGVGFVKNSRVMRAIYVGILGAFGAGGLVAGVAQAYVATLGAGNAGYGILFGTVFSGLALGMLIGPKVLPAVPRRIVFTLCIGAAGCVLVIMSLLQDFVGAAVASVVMGLFAGIAWITGFTMIGHEVSDRLRGRVFAFVMSSVRLILLGTIAVGPILANSIGFHLLSVGTFRMVLSGPAIVLAVSGVLTVVVALFAGRQVGGLRGERIRRVLRRLLQRPSGELLDVAESLPGALIAVVGADATANDRYARTLAGSLDAEGWQVHVRIAGTAADPGETAAGVLLEAAPGTDVATGMPAGEETPATALRAMADLGDLVSRDIRPLLAAGAVVVCRDYVDAAVVRFGAQAGMSEERIIRLATWATGGVSPDLTLLVDPFGEAAVAGAGGQDRKSDDTADGDYADGGAHDGSVGDVDQGGDGATDQGDDGGAGHGDDGAANRDDDGGADRDEGDAADRDDDGAADQDEGDEEPVDPRRVYEDLAASAPERYVSVLPLQDGERIPAEVAERVAAALRAREPVPRGAADQDASGGPAGADSVTDGPAGADSVTDGPAGADSVTDGPAGADSVTDGPAGADSVTDGPAGADSAADGSRAAAGTDQPPDDPAREGSGDDARRPLANRTA